MPCRNHIDAPYAFPRHRGETTSSWSTTISALFSLKGEYYQCPRCKRVTPKSKAKISGYDSENSLRHVHCLTCGRIVAWPSEGSKLKNIIEGTIITIAGGALTFLLYPTLNVYGLQAGFFASLYGVLKVLVL